MIKNNKEATYEVREIDYERPVKGSLRGLFFYTNCCKNTMFSISKNPLLYNGKLCPKCGAKLHLKFLSEVKGDRRR